MSKGKLLFVIQRYGESIHGGAEVHCRQIAEHLAEKYDVEVATTKATTYTTWSNDIAEDTEELNGVLIRRFKTDHDRFPEHVPIEGQLRNNPGDLPLNYRWMIAQGPMSSDLIKFLADRHGDYKKVIFFQYMYATTYYGMREIPAEKVVFVPLAHDEPQLNYALFRGLFRRAGSLILNTDIEYKWIDEYHSVGDKRSVVAGVGIEEPKKLNVEAFKKKFGVENYIVYVGRVDKAKMVDTLIDYFMAYKSHDRSDLKLVLVGKKEGDFPRDNNIIETGYVSDEEKWSAIAGAVALVNPSLFESLSLIVLESFAVKRPIIVNGFCEVLKEHCVLSNGGFWYHNQVEFEEVLKTFTQDSKLAKDMGLLGYNYVRSKYSWKVVLKKWIDIIEDKKL